MQTRIAMRHGHLSEQAQAKITAKVDKLAKYFERLTSIEVMVDLEHPAEPIVELVVSAEHKNDFVAREQSDDLMRSVDGAVQKLEQQLRKYKEKVQERHRQPGARRQGPAEPESTV